jgi:hypothetical protein
VIALDLDSQGSLVRWSPKHISTSYAERSNLSVRMHTRRFYSAHQRLLKEGRKPRAFGRAVRDILQFCAHP